MRQLAALLVLVPFTALSQSTEPQSASPQPEPVVAPPAPTDAALAVPALPVAPTPPAAAAVPLWSIGAGLSLNQAFIVSSLGVGGSFSFQSVPALSASLERRLSDRSWLVVGAMGSVSRYRQDDEPDRGETLRQDGVQLSLQGGLRRLLTSRTAPVDVSLLAVASVGGRFGKMTADWSGVRETTEDSSFGVGAEFGLSVERELSDGISLRVATELARLSWGWGRREVTGKEPLDESSLAGTVLIDPRLELRMAF